MSRNGSNGAAANVLERPDRALWDRMLTHPVANSIQSFMELDRGPTVLVLVGPDEVQFAMPMALLFHYSAMAERYLNSGFAEASSNILRLPDHEPDTFGFFKSYLMQGELRVHEYCRGEKGPFAVENFESIKEGSLLLCRLYILVDYLDVRYAPAIHSHIEGELDALAWESAPQPTNLVPEIVQEVFRRTVEGSGLRQFVIASLFDRFRRYGPELAAGYTECIREFPDEFGGQMMKSMLEKLDALEPIDMETLWDAEFE